MALHPGLFNQGWYEYGSTVLHDQIIITSKGVVKRNGRWVGGHIPGIY